MSSQLIRHSLLFRNLCLSKCIRSTRLVHRNHPGFKKRPFATPVKNDLPDSYVTEPDYPPVKPKFPPGEWLDKASPKLAWKYYDEGEKFHSLKTIQERLSVMAYLNVQQTLDDLKNRRTKYFPIYQLSSVPKTPQMLEFSQYITKTDLTVKENNEKEDTRLDASVSQDMYEKLKASVHDAIIMNFADRDVEFSEITEIPNHPDSYEPEGYRREKNLNLKIKKSDHLIRDILNSMTLTLASVDSNKHLIDAQYGNDVAIKAYWKRCGYKEQRPRGTLATDNDVIRYQYDDIATYQIKCDRPLKPLYKLNSNAVNIPIESKVPEYIYNPSNFKIFADHVLPMQVPGHWYGDKREFNFLTVLNTTKTLDLYNDRYSSCNGEFDFDALKSMLVTAGLAELTAQAYYLGFSMWKDLTYPLLGQYLLSNGQDFCLATYQLNTLRLWNPATSVDNRCFISVPERLFELNADKTGLESFNDDLFKKLINTLCNKPYQNENELVDEGHSKLNYKIGGSLLRPYLAVSDFEKQLSKRHNLFATSLYELVKYDKPMNYLNYRSESDPVTYRPQFPRHYDRLTYEYRDIVMNYYPRDYYGFKLVERMLKKAPKQSEKFWDLKQPVFEWANVPPPDTNNIPRDIDLPKF